MDAGGLNNFRSAVLTEPNIMPSMGSNGMSYVSSSVGDNFLRTPYAGNVRTLPPPVPQPPAQYGGYGSNSYMSGYGGYGGFGGGFGGGYGTGFGGFGGGYGGYGGYGYNRFGGMNPMDPEARFIQLAEASSRPAFASIESLVSAIGNIAAMLDSTFFALTSSFRAILGVAANFGRLRGVFAQFWQTMAIFRTLNWIYRKFLYWLRISKIDPSTDKFKKAFAEAANETAAQSGAPQIPQKGQSPWPVIAFLSFIFTVPYLVMKLLSTITNTAQEEARNPAKWIQPIETVALYDFQARNAGELTLRANSKVRIAPKEIQNTLHLLSTGWALATIDGQNTGIIPINYVKSPQQIRQDRQEYQQLQQQQQSEQITNLPPPIPKKEPNNIIRKEIEKVPQLSPCPANEDSSSIETLNLSHSAFASPSASGLRSEIEQNRILESLSNDFDIAPQPLGAPSPSTLNFTLANGLSS